MELDDTFTVEAPIDEVYATLLDLDRVTPCVPGAELISKNGDISTVGIKVKVGPISMQYRGDVEIIETDPAAHTATMRVKAREVRGAGTADATAKLSLTSDGGTTRGDVHVDVSLSGRAASMGQGAIQDVTSKMVGRFSRNLTRMLDTPAAEQGAAAGNGAAAGTASAPPPPVHDDDAIKASEVVGAVVVGRLKNPVVAGSLGALLVLIIALIAGQRGRE